jgi:hypothetical protein
LNDPVQQSDEFAVGGIKEGHACNAAHNARTHVRTSITAKIGHAGALAPNWKTGRVKRTNERRRTRRAKIYGT